jgi:hypothetical protein
MNLTIRRISSLSFAALMVACVSSGEAAAASMEQAKAQCHDKFAPIVRACVRKKAIESGGSPSQYISGCRDSIMAEARSCVAKLIGVENGSHGEGGPAEIDLPPPSGTGRVVLLLSGEDGTSPYQGYAEKLAKLGYYAVLLEGRPFLSDDMQGGVRLQNAIAKAQSSPSALPGKIAVVGFSLGGGAALTYAERQPEQVATVIAYYPATVFITKVTDIKTFVGKFQVPLLAFAGGKDLYKDCCLLTTIQSMQATATELGKPMNLVVYPNAEHNFIKGAGYRAEDADDAWKRTTATLAQYLTGP